MGFPSGARNPPCVLKIKNCFRPDLGGVPAHAGVLRQAEQIAARTVQKHFFGDRQAARRTGRFRPDLKNFLPCGFKQIELGHAIIEPVLRKLETEIKFDFSRTCAKIPRVHL